MREDGSPAGVTRDQRFLDHAAASSDRANHSTADEAVIGTHGSVGHLVRSLTTSGGSAIVPTLWAGELIDRARAPHSFPGRVTA